MDTRNKILDRAENLPEGPLAIVTGYFDVLRAEHVRALSDVRDRTPRIPLVAVVVQGGETLLPLGARAELVAALRMVDYVLTAADSDVDSLIQTLGPAPVVRLESADVHRVRSLKEHVHRRQE